MLKQFVLPLILKGKTGDEQLHNTTNALMQTLDIKILSDSSKEFSCDEDFNQNKAVNYPKKDHNKKWNHIRSKIKTESLDKMLEKEECLTQGEFDPESIAIANIKLKEIIENANAQKKQIPKFLSKGYTQSQRNLEFHRGRSRKR